MRSPLQGGCVFIRRVNLGIIKFLGFEQIFKNSLTTLPWAAARAAPTSNQGKSDGEVYALLQAFMQNSSATSGPNGCACRTSASAPGDWLSLRVLQEDRNEHTGVLTGKALEYGGSLIRPEATGYGTTYFAAEMLAKRASTSKQDCRRERAGNVAQ